MSLDSSLLEIVVCPECKGPLEHEDSRLICRRCRLAYPVSDDGVPVLIADEAQHWQPGEEGPGGQR